MQRGWLCGPLTYRKTKYHVHPTQRQERRDLLDNELRKYQESLLEFIFGCTLEPHVTNKTTRLPWCWTGVKEAETWSEIFNEGWTFQTRCINTIDTWGRNRAAILDGINGDGVCEGLKYDGSGQNNRTCGVSRLLFLSRLLVSIDTKLALHYTTMLTQHFLFSVCVLVAWSNGITERPSLSLWMCVCVFICWCVCFPCLGTVNLLKAVKAICENWSAISSWNSNPQHWCL